MFEDKLKLLKILADPCYLLADLRLRQMTAAFSLCGSGRDMQQVKILYLLGYWRSEFNEGDPKRIDNYGALEFMFKVSRQSRFLLITNMSRRKRIPL